MSYISNILYTWAMERRECNGEQMPLFGCLVTNKQCLSALCRVPRHPCRVFRLKFSLHHHATWLTELDIASGSRFPPIICWLPYRYNVYAARGIYIIAAQNSKRSSLPLRPRTAQSSLLYRSCRPLPLPRRQQQNSKHRLLIALLRSAVDCIGTVS